MLYLDAPANTLGYMIAGYTVIFGVILVYLASLIIRRRNLRRDLKLMEGMEDKDKEDK